MKTTDKKPLLAGFAKVKITPLEPQGMDLWGMPRIYPGARGIMDDLYARACYLESGTNKFLLIECDLVELLPQDYDIIINKLARSVVINRKNIWICATHCHSSVGGGSGPFQRKVLHRYIDRLTGQIIDVGIEAVQNKQRVQIGYSHGEIEHVVGNRRVKLSDGTVVTGWADGPSPPPGVRIVDRGLVDKNVGLIAFKNMQGQLVGAIVNYNSHIHSYPILYFSSELAGAVAALLDKKIPGMTTVYTNGAEGNTSLCANLTPQPPDYSKWNRVYRKERDRMSSIIVQKVLQLYKDMKFESTVAMTLDTASVKINTPPRKAVKTISAITINDLALVADEDEIFVEYALALKKNSPYPSTFIIGLKGMLNYYFIPTSAMEEGGYETYTWQPLGSFERTTATAIRLLRRMHPGKGKRRE
jgi:neutral ceramidase